MKNFRVIYKVALTATMACLLTACEPFQQSSYPPPKYPPPQYPPSGSPPYTPPGSQQPDAQTQPPAEIEPVQSRSAANHAAIASLLEQAWQYHYDGDYDRSIAVAERAQRLDASYAEIYLLLASNYYALSQLKLAEQLARQGLPLVGNLWDIERRLKQLLVRIAEAQG